MLSNQDALDSCSREKKRYAQQFYDKYLQITTVYNDVVSLCLQDKTKLASSVNWGFLCKRV